MTEKTPPGKAKAPGRGAAGGRDERLASALRQNLKRRKAQSRERSDAPAKAGEGGGDS
jgi:hypothetical protein